MDTNLFPLLMPLFFVAVLGLPPLFVLISTRTRVTKALATLSAPGPSVTVATLTPAELAYLCGGERRAVETALMGLHLDGRVRLRPRGGLLSDETGDERPDPADPVRGDLEKDLRRTGTIPVVDLMRLGRSGRGVARIRAGLAERGLMVDSGELREALLQRDGMRSLVGFCVSIGFLAVVIGALASGIDKVYGGLPEGIIIAGLVLTLLGFLSMLTATLTGGWRLSSLSCAGMDLVRAGRAEYGSLPATDTLTRDEALRRTAVHGMGRLKATGRRTGGGAVAAAGGDSTTGGEPTGLGIGEEPWIALESLHGFAEQCVRISGFDGSGGGDGGGGDGGGGGGGDGGGGGS